ncbi:MAG: hypothetical protein ISS92_06395 [Candidatus Omnitrophica bacterium]|nr:hypothetical protein [Candidatus Omnitrophota bacterium]
MPQYQDSFCKNKIINGGRECEERWKTIEQYLPPKGIILDVGSNLGYFGIRACLCNKDIAVVSLEAYEERVSMQKQITASHGLTRICLIHGVFNSDVTKTWSGRCDWFDLTLLLSIIHWFNEPAKVVYDLSRMSSRIIIEVPDPKDKRARGQNVVRELKNPLEWCRKVTGRNCSLIGRFERGTSHHPSHMILIEGPVRREVKLSCWDNRFSRSSKHTFQIEYDGKDGFSTTQGEPLKYTPGINLTSLMKLGRLVWPAPFHWMKSATRSFKDSHTAIDFFGRNLVWSAEGLRVIDKPDDNLLHKWSLSGQEPLQGKGIDTKHKINRSFELKLLKKTIDAWSYNETTDPSADVCRHSLKQIIVNTPVKLLKRAVRKILPATWINRIKQFLKR